MIKVRDFYKALFKEVKKCMLTELKYLSRKATFHYCIGNASAGLSGEKNYYFRFFKGCAYVAVEFDETGEQTKG